MRYRVISRPRSEIRKARLAHDAKSVNNWIIRIVNFVSKGENKRSRPRKLVAQANDLGKRKRCGTTIQEGSS